MRNLLNKLLKYVDEKDGVLSLHYISGEGWSIETTHNEEPYSIEICSNESLMGALIKAVGFIKA